MPAEAQQKSDQELTEKNGENRGLFPPFVPLPPVPLPRIVNGSGFEKNLVSGRHSGSVAAHES